MEKERVKRAGRMAEKRRERTMKQDIQRDWEKIDKSSYCPIYKQIKASPET